MENDSVSTFATNSANALSKSFILLSGESFPGRQGGRLRFSYEESFSFPRDLFRPLFRVLFAERGENGGNGEIGK